VCTPCRKAHFTTCGVPGRQGFPDGAAQKTSRAHQGNGIKKLLKISDSVKEDDRSYKGFNFFSQTDQKLFEVLARGEFNIKGLKKEPSIVLTNKRVPHQG